MKAVGVRDGHLRIPVASTGTASHRKACAGYVWPETGRDEAVGSVDGGRSAKWRLQASFARNRKSKRTGHRRRSANLRYS